MSQKIDITKGFHIHEEKIVEKWIDYTLSTYQSSDFFKKERNQFSNPIGGRVRTVLTALLPELIAGSGRSKYEAVLTDLIAVRAVQQFSPSQALAPINAVKHIVREIFAADSACTHLAGELYDFDFAVDITLLAAFDLYMQFRERLYSVRIQEIQSGNIVLADSKCPSKLLSENDSTPLQQVGK